jgi:transposase-like protein
MQTAATKEPILTPIQQKVLEFLADGASTTAAAETAGVHRNTIANWRRTIPAFNSALDEALRDRALLQRESAAELVPQALQVVRTILHTESASPSVQLRAALAVFKMAAPPDAPRQQQMQPAPDPEIRPSLNAALQAEIGAISEQHAQIRRNMHNLAQSAGPQPIRRPAEPGRNSLCPCGSGVKYKRCCANSIAQPVGQTTVRQASEPSSF